MARGDLIKDLFLSYKRGDDEAFLAVANVITEEERKKHHVVLANELTRILKNNTPKTVHPAKGLAPLPKDPDRGTPLMEVRWPNQPLEHLVLSGEQRDSLDMVMDEFRHWEILEMNGLAPSQKMLFCGPPGCGKTATAEAIACEMGLPLLYVRFDSVVSSLLGETSANLRRVFDYAITGSWVILFDEFDAVGRSRDDPTEHSELKRVVNAFLQLLDSFTGRSLIIAATNFEQSLDVALWRRFDEIIRFDKPTSEQLTYFLERRLFHLALPPETMQAATVSLQGMSFADVERVCLDVLKRLALEGRQQLIPALLTAAVARQQRRKHSLTRTEFSVSPTVSPD
jgi:ATP-dependent 26S proteasome regulatory subunit